MQTLIMLLVFAILALGALSAKLALALGKAKKDVAKLAEALTGSDMERFKALEFAARESRRAEDQFKVIEDVIRERRTWQEIYQEQSRQAVAAQDWLMRDLGRILFVANRLLKAAGKPEIGIDKRLEELICEYKGAHPAPTVEAARGVVESKKPAPSAEEPSAPSRA